MYVHIIIKYDYKQQFKNSKKLKYRGFKKNSLLKNKKFLFFYIHISKITSGQCLDSINVGSFWRIVKKRLSIVLFKFFVFFLLCCDLKKTQYSLRIKG